MCAYKWCWLYVELYVNIIYNFYGVISWNILGFQLTLGKKSLQTTMG